MRNKLPHSVLQKSDPKGANLAAQSRKPEILKSWQTKLLVLVLCLLSFIAGWASSRSHANKECWQAGGQIALVNSIVVCQM